MEEYSGYVGLDVHKDTISPALAHPGRSKPESLGVIANTKKCDRQHEEINSESGPSPLARGRSAWILLRGGTVWIRSLPLD